MVFLFLEQMHHPNTFILFCRSVPNKQYGNMGCEVSKIGIENYIDFWQKINILQGNYRTLSIDVFCFLKLCPTFDNLTTMYICLFTKYNNGQKNPSSNFLSLPRKHYNPYCQTGQQHFQSKLRLVACVAKMVNFWRGGRNEQI